MSLITLFIPGDSHQHRVLVQAVQPGHGHHQAERSEPRRRRKHHQVLPGGHLEGVLRTADGRSR